MNQSHYAGYRSQSASMYYYLPGLSLIAEPRLDQASLTAHSYWVSPHFLTQRLSQLLIITDL